MIPVKPEILSDAEWTAVQRAQDILTEYFPNIGIFINWVCDEKGETKRAEFIRGNMFALRHHIDGWVQGEFDEDCDDDFDDDDEDDSDNWKRKQKA